MKNAPKTYVWAGLVGVVLAAAALGGAIRQMTTSHLIAQGERDTVALTHAFANALGAEWFDWVEQAAALPAEELKAHPRTTALQALARNQLRGTDVAKIKIYALNGRTVFSTEAAQIGDSKAANAGFQAARSGATATELTYREKFSAFDNVIEKRNLLSAYVPLRDPKSAQVRVVFELYSDVTPLIQDIDRSQAWAMAAVVGVLLLYFALQSGMVRVVLREMQRRNGELERSAEQLGTARDELELRVHERSAQLEQAQVGLKSAWQVAQRAQSEHIDALVRTQDALREPLHTTLNAARMLAQTGLDAAQRRQLERIEHACTAVEAVLMQRPGAALVRPTDQAALAVT